MAERSTHRLSGLEPENLLAFLALLGTLRSLEHVRPAWRPRVAWTIDAPPVRPTLTVAAQTTEAEIAAVVAEGLADLASRHDFGQLKDLKLSPEEAAARLHEAASECRRRPCSAAGPPEEAVERLRGAAAGDRYAADLWAALTSDAAVRDRNKAQEAEPTPLCLLFGQGHMHFMSRLASVPQESAPPARGTGRGKTAVGEVDCLREALFEPWTRPDATFSFRWDPHEDVRYALRATDPTDSKSKETTQHGANRLAAIGLSALTVVPRLRGTGAQLSVLGGMRERSGFAFTWPIWHHPISLAAIRSLLGHTGLDKRATWDALGIVELRRARRISVGKFMNFTRAESIGEPEAETRVSRNESVAASPPRLRGRARRAGQGGR